MPVDSAGFAGDCVPADVDDGGAVVDFDLLAVAFVFAAVNCVVADDFDAVAVAVVAVGAVSGEVVHS